jgi:hypothetical protein
MYGRDPSLTLTMTPKVSRLRFFSGSQDDGNFEAGNFCSGSEDDGNCGATFCDQLV